MSDISSWQQVIKKELKTDQVERFLTRNLAEGIGLSLLETEATSWHAPATTAPALSVCFVDGKKELAKVVPGLLKQGVWNYILDPEYLGWSESKIAEEVNALKETEARVWVITNWNTKFPKVVTPVLAASDVHALGGHAVHEMGYLLDQLISWAQSDSAPKMGVAVYCDSEFFKSIAKIRAMKAITLAMLKEMKKEFLFERITWLGRSSLRDFTAFDAASNILRNATALSAAYIGEVNVVESLPYDILIESTSSITERAERLALTSQLVLQQESFLGEISDASYGSFSIESLTHALGEKAWTLMQELQSKNDKLAYLKPLIEEHWREVQQKFNTRKIVQTGINDFPDGAEKVQLKSQFQNSKRVRLGQKFEELRIEMQKASKPKVAVVVIGDYAGLNARLSFTKNFFELLGLEVTESGKGLKAEKAQTWLDKSDAKVWAIVAADSDHESIHIKTPANTRSYLAGKTKLEGFNNLFAGMDVFHALEELSQWGRSL